MALIKRRDAVRGGLALTAGVLAAPYVVRGALGSEPEQTLKLTYADVATSPMRPVLDRYATKIGQLTKGALEPRLVFGEHLGLHCVGSIGPAADVRLAEVPFGFGFLRPQRERWRYSALAVKLGNGRGAGREVPWGAERVGWVCQLCPQLRVYCCIAVSEAMGHFRTTALQ